MLMFKMNFTSRRFLRLAIMAVATLTLFGVILMIFNEKSLHDTITDIIVLLVGAIALVMAVLTEADMEKQEKRSLQIHREVLEALKEIREVNQDGDNVIKEVDELYKLEKSINSKIAKIHDKLENTQRNLKK